MKLAESIIRFYESSIKDQIKKIYKVEDKDFEKADPSHAVCSLAKTKEGYVGYSHRASHEFKIGDKLYDPQWDDNGKLTQEQLGKMKYSERGETVIKTIDQAREAACRFAEEVS